MAEKAGKALLAPQILSVESFVEQLSGLRYATTTKLLFSLYEAFLEQKGVEPESFYDFSKWGQMLLQDFNEVDRYLVDPDAFFKHLGSLQEIRHWTVDGSSTPMIEKRVRFWKSLEPIYHLLRDKLASEGLGYQGQVYRSAADRVDAYLKRNLDKTHLFMGFNALNRAEETIFQHILKEGDGKIYWDADPYYLDNPTHDAGLFIRKHRDTWDFLEKDTLLGLSQSLASPRQIRITGLPKSVSQAKYCGSLIEKLLREKGGDIGRTALVLGQESLMNPIMHSLPENLNAVNITMGYPLGDSPAADLFDMLFAVFLGVSNSRLPTKAILKACSHPYLKAWFDKEGFDSKSFASELIRTNTRYLTGADLVSHHAPEAIRKLFSLEPEPGPMNLIARFRELAGLLRPVYQDQKDTLSLEYLYHFYVLFGQLLEVSGQYPFITDLKSLRFLYEQLVREDRIDFQGEPLEGLQVMGMLESRNLDFDTVIITSVNEGILPAGKTQVSFVPFEVKRQFGLPTYKEKDAVYTYHFYRLLQRAKSIHICYNTEPDVLEGGEPSRFIHQLRNDPKLAKYIHNTLAAPEAESIPVESIEIPKTPALMAKLTETAAEGFSPTSLSRYIENPLEFYRKQILGIPDSEEFEETIAANTFGNVLHEALEVLYRPLVGQILESRHITRMRSAGPAELHSAFQKHYLKGGEARGKNLIALQVMNTYLDLFLQMESHRIKEHRIRILGVEERLVRKIPEIPGLEVPVLLKGTVDRIEEVDGQLQIIDYKTGKVEPKHLRLKHWDELLEDPQKSKAFQVLCYSWLIQEQYPVPPDGFRAGVYSFKNTAAGLQWYGLHTSGWNYDTGITAATLAHFEGVLGRLLKEVCDTELPFAQPGEA